MSEIDTVFFDFKTGCFIFVKTHRMKERIEKLLKEKSLSANRLAELLGVQPSGISHILAGRNKPSLDFIFKLLKTYPDISPDWFILGEGDMYRQTSHATEIIDETPDKRQPNTTPSDDLTLQFSRESESADLFSDTPVVDRPQPPSEGAMRQDPGERSARKQVRQVMILYSDHTVEIFDYSDRN